jgi:hypothetical protein
LPRFLADRRQIARDSGFLPGIVGDFEQIGVRLGTYHGHRLDDTAVDGVRFEEITPKAGQNGNAKPQLGRFDLSRHR